MSNSNIPFKPSRSLPLRRRHILWSSVLFTCVLIYLLAPSSIYTREQTSLDLESERPLAHPDPAPTPVTLLASDSDADEVISSPQSADADDEFIEEEIEDELEDDIEMPATTSAYGTYGSDELQNLLHMVASSELQIPKDVDPSKPLDPSVYGADLNTGASWLKKPSPDPPVIVFSKTYCPYSAKAKTLIKSLNLSPEPKIVEVDRRSDDEQLKIILTRLTGRSTFPNVFLNGQSLGGSDELHALQNQGELIPILQSAHVTVNVS